MSIYANDAVVRELTRAEVSRGHRIFQIFKLGACDTTHTKALLDYFQLPHGARVLDVGCGVGEVAARMKALRPDLSFTLLNISPSQLALSPEDMAKVCARAEACPFNDGSFDAVLVFYTMGHTDLCASMAEYARCLAPGGSVCVYDMLNRANPRCLATLDYYLYPFTETLSEANAHGLTLDRCAEHQIDATVDEFMEIMPREQFAQIFAGVTPLLAQFRK